MINTRKKKGIILGSMNLQVTFLNASSRRLSNNLKSKIYKTIILPVELCGCEIH